MRPHPTAFGFCLAAAMMAAAAPAPSTVATTAPEAARALAPAEPIRPDEAVQEMYRRFEAAGVTRGGRLRVAAEVADLLEEGRAAPQHLLRQMLYYLSRDPERAKRSVVPAIVQHDLFSDLLLLQTASPYLEARDEHLRRAAEAVLTWRKFHLFRADGRWTQTQPTFRAGLDYLGGSPPAVAPLAEPPPFLIKLMYGVDPRAALFTMSRAYLPAGEEARAIARDEHAVRHHQWMRERLLLRAGDPPAAEAAEATRRLARHDRWWARLYALFVIEQYGELGTEQIVRQFLEDPHPVVRGVARDLESAQQLESGTLKKR